MIRQLWLLRHADAEPHGARPDPERRLTERGERQAHLAGRALARADVAFQSILVSPKTRALQTAQIALAELGGGQRELMRTHPPLAAGFDARQALDALAEIASGERLLLVGHEPDMSGVLGELTGSRAEVKKGGLAMMRIGGAARAELALLLRPHELALMADGERP